MNSSSYLKLFPSWDILDRFLVFITSALLLLGSHAARAADEVNAAMQLALHGYDPVSYFEGEPLPGSSMLSTLYQGIRYQFATLENKQRFMEKPERYVPMYGGYCAYGVRMGKKLDIDPDAYEVVDDRLYVLLNRSTHQLWKKDRERNIHIADIIWPRIKEMPVGALQ